MQYCKLPGELLYLLAQHNGYILQIASVHLPNRPRSPLFPLPGLVPHPVLRGSCLASDGATCGQSRAPLSSAPESSRLAPIIISCREESQHLMQALGHSAGLRVSTSRISMSSLPPRISLRSRVDSPQDPPICESTPPPLPQPTETALRLGSAIIGFNINARMVHRPRESAVIRTR